MGWQRPRTSSWPGPVEVSQLRLNRVAQLADNGLTACEWLVIRLSREETARERKGRSRSRSIADLAVRPAQTELDESARVVQKCRPPQAIDRRRGGAFAEPRHPGLQVDQRVHRQARQTPWTRRFGARCGRATPGRRSPYPRRVALSLSYP